MFVRTVGSTQHPTLSLTADIPPRATVPSGIFAARPTDTDVFFRCGPSELDYFSSSSKLSVVKAAQGIYHCRPLLARCGEGGSEAAQLTPHNHPGETLTRVCSFSDTHNQPALSRQRVSSFSIDGIIMRFVAGLGQFIGRLVSMIYVYSVHGPLLLCCCLY